MTVTALLLVLVIFLVRLAGALRKRNVGRVRDPDLGTLALRELKTTRYTLLRADSVLQHLWLQAPAHSIAPLRDSVVRERFRRSLQRRINLWGRATALVRGRRWQAVTLTLRMRASQVVRVTVTPVGTAAPTPVRRDDDRFAPIGHTTAPPDGTWVDHHRPPRRH